MKYNLADKSEKSQAMSYFMKLVNKKSLVEVKKISPRRTLNQNSYLHLLIGAFAAHFGYTIDEAKIVYKDMNMSTFLYEKNGRKFYRSTADLDKEEMAKTIDTFMQKSAEQGCTLPLATDQEWLRQIENEIERSRYYL